MYLAQSKGQRIQPGLEASQVHIGIGIYRSASEARNRHTHTQNTVRHKHAHRQTPHKVMYTSTHDQADEASIRKQLAESMERLYLFVCVCACVFGSETCVAGSVVLIGVNRRDLCTDGAV